MAIAQLNIGRLLADADDPLVAEFINNIERINQLGKNADGFLWMMEGSSEAGNTENYLYDDPRMVANLTLWRDIEALRAFAFKSEHVEIMRKRSLWFEKLPKAHFVMWEVDDNHQPTLEEALERLEFFRENGATDDAFDWAYVKTNPQRMAD